MHRNLRNEVVSDAIRLSFIFNGTKETWTREVSFQLFEPRKKPRELVSELHEFSINP